MARDTGTFEPLVAERIRELGSLENARALPDPNWIWARAQISAREEAAATALRRWTTGRLWRLGILVAGAAWLLVEWIRAAAPSLDRQVQTVALPFVDPIANVMMLLLAMLGAAFVIGGLILRVPLVTTRLRYFGLL